MSIKDVAGRLRVLYRISNSGFLIQKHLDISLCSLFWCDLDVSHLCGRRADRVAARDGFPVNNPVKAEELPWTKADPLFFRNKEAQRLSIMRLTFYSRQLKDHRIMCGTSLANHIR